MCPGSTVPGPLDTGWPRALIPLEMTKTALFRLFRAFPAFLKIQAALAYCLDQSGQERAK